MDVLSKWFRMAIADYPAPKVGPVQMTEKDVANHELVLATRIKNDRIEYLLNLRAGSDAKKSLFEKPGVAPPNSSGRYKLSHARGLRESCRSNGDFHDAPRHAPSPGESR